MHSVFFSRIANPALEVWDVPSNRWWRCVWCHALMKESRLRLDALPEEF